MSIATSKWVVRKYKKPNLNPKSDTVVELVNPTDQKLLVSVNESSVGLFSGYNNTILVVLLIICAIILASLITYIIYDLVVHHTTILVSTSNGQVDLSVMKDKGISIKENMYRMHTFSSLKDEPLFRKSIIKIINYTEILDAYLGRAPINKSVLGIKHVKDNNVDILYKSYSIGGDQDNQPECTKIWSSMDLSCCCFSSTVYRNICNKDEPYQFNWNDEINISSFNRSENNLNKAPILKVACGLIHDKEVLHQSGKQAATNSVYLGLSTDFIHLIKNMDQPYKTQDSCFLKMNYVCIE